MDTAATQTVDREVISKIEMNADTSCYIWVIQATLDGKLFPEVTIQVSRRWVEHRIGVPAPTDVYRMVWVTISMVEVKVEIATEYSLTIVTAKWSQVEYS